MTRIFLGIFFFFFCNLVPLKEIKFKKKKEKWGGGGKLPNMHALTSKCGALCDKWWWSECYAYLFVGVTILPTVPGESQYIWGFVCFL